MPERSGSERPRASELLDVFKHQRAHREYRDDPVPDEDIEAILTAATHAPSAENRQPWEFIVVREARGRRALCDLMARIWDGGAKELTRPVIPGRLFDDVDRGFTSGFATAPVLIVCCAHHGRGRRETAGSSVFPAVQNLLVAATALGYGTALTTLATVASRDVAQLLDLPDTVEAMAVVPLGRPARELGPGRREPAAIRTHREKYGRPWGGTG